MNIARLTKTVEKLVVDNSPVILTAVGVVGTVATAYYAGKAAIKAAKTLDSIEEIRALNDDYDDKPLPLKKQIKHVWKDFVPPVAAGTVTIAAIVFSNRISTRRAAALAAAYSVSERAYSEYKDKVVEKLGVKKDQEVLDSVGEDRLKNDPISNKTIIITEGGEVVCYDKISGRYFKSSMESIKQAVNDTNYQLLQEGYQDLSQFYERLGIPPNGFSDEVGWNHDKMLDVQFSTIITDDGRPCLVLDYDLSPNRKFQHFAE